MSIDVAHAIEMVLSLPAADRLKVAGAVWDSLPEPPIAPTAEQQAELDRRLDALEADPNDMLTWDEVVEELRGQL